MSKTEKRTAAQIMAGLYERYEDEVSIFTADLLRRLDAENKQLNVALDEWMEKTHWVQDTAQVLELGMHRADVLRARIEALAAAKGDAA